MLSHAQTGRRRVISCHLRDIGGYGSTVGYICYRGKEPWDNVTGGRAESMCRLTHVILFVLIKDRTIVGTFVEIEHMPHLAGRITRSYREAEKLNSGRAPFYQSAHSGWQ